MDMRHGYVNGVLRDDSVYVTNASTQLLYCLVLAMCEQYHAARRYAIRCLRRVVRFDPATICLALTFVFLSIAGAVAQTAALVAQAGPDQPTVVSGKEVQLDGTGSTVTEGSRTVTYDWERTGGTMGGSVTLTAANTLRPSFTPAALDLGAAAVTHIFTLTVTDNLGSTAATDMVTITVTAPPIAVPGFDQRVPSGWPVVLDGSRSVASAGNRITEYFWISVENAPECDPFPPHTIDGALARFTAEDLAPGAEDVTYCFFLQVEQSNGDKSSFVGPLKVTVTNSLDPYERPVAKIAGGDREVASGGTVTLDGIGSTLDRRTTVTYRWARTGGTSMATGTLTGEKTHRASFTVETLTAGAEDVTHILTLTVTDFQGGSSTATVTITVTAALVANAGPDLPRPHKPRIFSGATVQLDGSGSTASGGGRNVTYAWTRAGGTGSAVKLSDTTAVDPTFTAETLNPGDAPVTYIFTLTVTDSANESDTDTVTITVLSRPAEPVAHAGDDELVGSGGTVTLDGNRSTVDYRRSFSNAGGISTGLPPLLYSWARTGGTSTATGTLTGATTATPSFTAETRDAGAPDVTHVFTLTVTDELNVSDTDTVTITVRSLFADAGEAQSVASGATVTLDGSGSTATDSSRVVTYAWTQTGGTTVTLSNTTVLRPTFTAQALTAGAADVTYEFTLRVRDDKGSTEVTDTVTITVKAPGFPALVAHAGPDQDNVASGASVTLDGSGSTPTGSGRVVSYAWTQTGGTTVTLADDTTLAPSFTADTLNPGDTDVTYEFTLRVRDDKGSTEVTDTVTITVKAPGFPALVAHAGPDQDNVASGASVTLDGSGSTPTGSGRVVSYAWTQTGGTTVTLADDTTLAPSFTADTLNPGDTDVTYEFTLRVRDDKGSTEVTDTVTITVKAPGFPALVAHAGPDQDNVASGASVTLDGSGSTPTGSGRVVSYAWTQTGGTTVTLADDTTLAPSFTADTLNPGDTDVTYEFTLRVRDDKGSTEVTDTVTITVKAPGFPALVAHAGPDQDNVASGASVTLDGSGSTPTGSGRVVSYAWTQTGGTTVTLADDTTLAPSFTADTLNPGDTDVTYEFTLRVRDDKGSTEVTDTVTITVKAPGFPALVAHAGPDQDNVASGASVTLDGSGSTPTGSGRVVSYAWTQTGGTTVTLADDTTLAPSFTADTLNPGDTDVTYEFTLRVRDDKGSTEVTDTVTITVKAPGFPALVAHAGPDQDNVASGASVTLDGSGSTPTGSGRVVSYAWTQTGGTTVTLADDTTLAPSFTADTLNPGDTDVTYEFTLRVRDDKGSTEVTDTVTITVKAPGFGDLVAEAGDPQTVDPGDTVTLEGSGTATGGGRNVTYAWTQTGGDAATVTLSDTTVLRPTFTAQALTTGAADVTYVFTLTVSDDAGSTAATDTVTITVKAPGFPALVAHAGPDQDNVASGASVTLDGSGSTPTGSGRVVSYAWTQTGGTTVTLADDTTLAPSFTADTLNPGDTDVTYEFTLRVRDDKGSTEVTDTVTITVKAPGFPALVAHAGPDQDNVASGASVTLDGSGSTPTGSGRVVSYAWTQTGGTTVTLADDTTLAPSFTADTLNPGDTDVTYEFTLRVRDDKGSTEVTDTVTITVKAPGFGDLVAEAGDPQTVDPGDTVTLEGSGTATGGGRNVTYAWTQTGGDAATVTLSDTTVLRPTFTAQALTTGAADVTYVFTLTVSDDAGSTAATDTVTITVTPLAALVAEAGDARSVVSGTQGVQLDGTGSTLTGGGRAVTYLWDRTGGDGATVTLTDADTLRPTFTAQTLNPGDAAVTYIFTLKVTDDQSSAAATDTVTITAVPVDILDSPFELIGVSPLLFGLIVSAVDILVSTSELTVQEGGSSAYQVRLSESPGQDVIVTAVSDNENVVLENAQLTFNANNWDAWQEIRIGTVAGSENVDGKTLIEHRLDTGEVALRQSGVVSVTVREEDPVLRPVGENLTARAMTLLNNLPNLSSFLKQDRTTPGGSSGFTFKATNGHLTLDGGFVRDGVWGEIAGSYTRSDYGDTRFVLGSFGIHRKYSEHFLAGAMLQIDLADHDLDGKSGSIDGTGWLVGPYFAARHGTWPLYFEGRLLYGQSDNDIRFNDSELGEIMRMGSFDTTRMLAQLRLEGEIALSDGDEGPRLIPYADTHWFEDRAAAFTDSIGTRISGQTISIGQLELGSNVEVPIAMSHGAMTFTGGLGLVYSKTEGDYIPSVSRSRGRGEIGFSYGLDDNVRIDFESFYDGIGTSGYEGYGLSLNAEIKF